MKVKKLILVVNVLLLLCVFSVLISASTQSDSNMEFMKDDSGNYIPVFAIIKDAKILEEPKKGSKVKNKPEFMEYYYILEQKSESPNTFYKIAKPDETGIQPDTNTIGWINSDDVLYGYQAKKATAGIYLKAIVVNKWDKISGDTKITGASLRNGPGKTYDELNELGLFNFYYVFKEKTDKSTGNTYLFIGTGSHITSLTNPKNVLLGWVDKSQMILWETRQAVEFNKETLSKRIEKKDDWEKHEKGVQIFETEREIEDYVKGLEGLKTVADEDVSLKQWAHNVPRFPIFEKKENYVSDKAGQFYRIGYIGDRITMGGKRVDSETTAEEKEKLIELGKDFRSLDLLFVIDSTGSMKKYFKDVAEGVQLITDEINKEYSSDDPDKPNIRFSVTFYRDYVDKDGKAKSEEGNPADSYITKRLPLTGDIELVKNFLNSEEIPSGAGGDAPEAVFYAIDDAIRQSQGELEGREGYKVILLIGDLGNHKYDEKGYTAEKIAENIKDQDFDFSYIWTMEGEVDVSESAKRFKEDCETIYKKIHKDETLKLPTDYKKMSKLIKDMIIEKSVELVLMKDIIEGIVYGDISLVKIKNQHGVRITEKMIKLMEKKGINPENYIEKSIQIFGDGWSCQNDPLTGENQLREVIIIDRGTFEKYLVVLNGFVKEPLKRENITSLWVSALNEANIGDVDVDKSVAELLEAHFGIPVRKGILKMPLSELKGLPQTKIDSMYKDIKKDYLTLQGFYAEKKLDVSVSDIGEIDVKELGPSKVWWEGRDTQYGWIPLDKFP